MVKLNLNIHLKYKRGYFTCLLSLCFKIEKEEKSLAGVTLRKLIMQSFKLIKDRDSNECHYQRNK